MLCYVGGVPRPRVHDLDRLLDVAESLVAGEGPDRLTVRGLSAAAGVTNGTIYHAFGSVGSLLGEVWLRAGTDFLRLQRELVDQALGPVPDPDFGTVVGAVVAAADAPVVFADRRPAAARMLLTVKRDRLLGPDLPADLAGALIDLDKSVVSLLTRLAELLWGRRDGAAVEVLSTSWCQVPPTQPYGPNIMKWLGSSGRLMPS
jgi:AcrR family transcriptional regulator